MFIQLFKFELLTRLRRSSSYIYFFVFFAIAFTVMSLMGSNFKNFGLHISNSNVLYANSPFVLFLLIAGLSHFGIFVTMAIIGQSVLHDFDNNCHSIFSNEAKKAEFTKISDGKFDVTLSLEATKILTDSLGNKTNISLNDYIEVGVLDRDRNPIYLAKHKFTKSAETIRFTIDKEPFYGAIDPEYILIDQIRKDNIIRATVSK